MLSGNAEPVANAGPDQPGVVPTSTVTLDGTASKFASSFAWTQDAGDQVQLGTALKNPTTANPTFVVPASSSPVTFNFTLTIKDVNGTASTDTVQVVTDPGVVTVDSAFYKRGDLQWQVQGSAKYCSANNLISVYWNKPVTGGGTTPTLIGTTTPALALGVCHLGVPGEERGRRPAAHRSRDHHGPVGLRWRGPQRAVPVPVR